MSIPMEQNQIMVGWISAWTNILHWVRTLQFRLEWSCNVDYWKRPCVTYDKAFTIYSPGLWRFSPNKDTWRALSSLKILLQLLAKLVYNANIFGKRSDGGSELVSRKTNVLYWFYLPDPCCRTAINWKRTESKVLILLGAILFDICNFVYTCEL